MNEKTVRGTVLDERVTLSIVDLCLACSCQEDWIIELVEYGVLEPTTRKREEWRFSVECLTRVSTARRLQEDLGVNIEGVALTLDLLEEIGALRSKLDRLTPGST